MRYAASILLALAAVASSAGAQVVDLASADRAPRFLYAASARATPVAVEPRSIAALGRRVTLQLDDVSLRDALDAISRESGLRLFYSKDLLPLQQVVRIRAEDLTVAAVLTEVLFDTDVDVLLGPNNQAALVRRGTLPQGGTITGQVTDARTASGVAGVRMFLERTPWSTTTDSAGRYRLADVAAGAYTLVARRIGYKPATQAVTVEDEREVAVNVVLQPAPSELEAVVVTATGEQRLLELGHVVGQIKADSLVRAAPVTSVSDLLTARVPGVLVEQNDGQVGGGNRVRIRGANTVWGSTTAPVVFVDGIRYEASRLGGGPFSVDPNREDGAFRVQPPSRLNDLNINDVESIEIVKGPSAATLYGPDAANGVIVITTKRGRPGPARWRAYARSGMTEVPVSTFPDVPWGWSTRPTGQQNTFSCSLQRVASGTCVRDSVTNIGNPLNAPEWAIFASRPRWEYGANVSGGVQDVRYYFSADLEEATGPMRLPPAAQALAERRRGEELPQEHLEPNRFLKANLRANVAASLGGRGELHISTAYTQSATRTIGLNESIFDLGAFRIPTLMSGNPFRDSTPYALSPEVYFSQTSTEHLKRWTLSATGQWRLTAWLLGRTVAGLDLDNTIRQELRPRGVLNPNTFDVDGEVTDARRQTVGYTFTVDATATARRGRLSSRTVVGAQYHRLLTEILRGSRTNLLPGGTSFGEATVTRFVVQDRVELATLGSYVEQTVGLNERLFVTGAFRGDGASTFGRDVNVSLHPKASISWLASAEPFFPRMPGLEEVRLRYAFGSSLIQPDRAVAHATFSIGSAFVEGQVRSVADRSTLPSPDLRPERVREHEFGMDASALGQRVRLELSWYRRRVADGIHVFQPPSSFGGVGDFFWKNVGLVTSNGFEAQLTARLVNTRPLSLDATLSHSYNDNRLVDLGDASPGDFGIGGVVEGYPLGAVFVRPVVAFADTAGGGADGIIEANEVQLADSSVFVGRGIPPSVQTLTMTLGLFNHRVRISALIDRRAGHVVANWFRERGCQLHRCREALDPNTPLDQQAEVVALNQTFESRFFEKGDIARLRELSVVVNVPQRLVRALRLGEATLTLQGRNVAVLSKAFEGQDPESAVAADLFVGSTRSIPQSRTWAVRLDIGF